MMIGNIKTAVVTGVTGFVGRYLSEHLRARGMVVSGCDLALPPEAIAQVEVQVLDITDAARVQAYIAAVQPDYVFHLAGLSSVSLSFKKPEVTRAINVGGTRNLLDALKNIASKAKIVIVSSAEVYRSSSNPLKETDELDGSLSPYAASRVEQEALCAEYPDLHIRISRSFNHIGPRQAPQFVAASFAQQVAQIMLGQAEPLVRVGNLEVIRDFSDVRDMVTAYLLLAERGQDGEVYNIGSSRGVTVRFLLDYLITLSGRQIEVQIDPERYRASDNPMLICDNAKFVQQTGWQAAYSLEQTLADMLEYWRQLVALSGASEEPVTR
ncbi:MAG TPA: GDP-mannose 4,6-dehydratase [bacterium]|nr:GDP-mannose 4,6-dehydratase [bacterium]